MATTTLAPQAGVYSGRRAWIYEWLTTTDHKKIGAMYITTAFGFFLVGGIFALLIRSELAVPGRPVRDPETVQPALHHARDDHDLPVRDADDDRPRELHRPAPDRRGRHGLPAHQRPVVLDGPARRPAALLRLRLRRRRRRRLDRLRAAIGTERAPGVDLWIAWPDLLGISSILGAINFIATIFKMRAPGMTLLRMPMFVLEHARDQRAAAVLDPGADGRPDDAVHRPQLRRWLLRSGAGRQPDPVAARVLVLRPPRGVRADPAGVRHRDRDRAGVQPQATLRLQGVRLRHERRSAPSASPSGRTTCSRPARSTCRSSASSPS